MVFLGLHRPLFHLLQASELTLGKSETPKLGQTGFPAGCGIGDSRSPLGSNPTY